MNWDFTNQSLMFYRSESQRFARALQPNGGRLAVAAESSPDPAFPTRTGLGATAPSLPKGPAAAAAYT